MIVSTQDYNGTGSQQRFGVPYRLLNLTSLAALPALAQDSLRIDGLDVIGRPVDGETGFQPAVTRLAQDIHDLDYLILVIITLITIFVTGLIIWVMIRYNKKRNPNPSSFTHHTPIEIAWTILPILVLVPPAGNPRS